MTGLVTSGAYVRSDLLIIICGDLNAKKRRGEGVEMAALWGKQKEIHLKKAFDILDSSDLGGLHS